MFFFLYSANTSAFTSGTINGTSGSILKWLELSITMQPDAANLGAHSLDISPPAENKATCISSGLNFSKEETVISFSPNETFIPSLLLEAMGKIFSDLKPFSESIESISLPTFPVAPTIPIFKVIMILYYYKPQQSYHPFAE